MWRRRSDENDDADENDHEDQEPDEPGNQDQPVPAGLCPVPPGPHDWTYDAYVRTCSKCGAVEASH